MSYDASPPVGKNPPTFSDLIGELRTRKSLTQEQLASELRVSFATINRWETGKTVPDEATLHRLADFARKQGADLSDLAGRLDAGGFSVPARSRRAKRKQTDDSDASVVLDVKSMETMLWKAACSIRGEKDAPKFKDYILPLLFIKRLSDVFEDEVTSLTATYGSEVVAREVLEADHSLVRFYVPAFATWPVIAGRQQYDWPDERETEKPESETPNKGAETNETPKSEKASNQKPKTLGEHLTTATRAIARENPSLQGVIDIVDFNETRNGEREISDDALSGVIELFSQPRYRLGLQNVEPDFLGRAYEYLLRKFAEGQGQSAGEFFTPKEVGWLIAYLVKPQQGEEVYDPTCGSAGLLVKCELALLEQEKAAGREVKRPLKLYGQELTGSSYAIARMNMVLHDMEGEIVRGNTMTNPKFLDGASLKKFDIVVANPMWNQNNFASSMYESDTFDRFGGGVPPESSADWGWLQHIAASLKEGGRAAVVLDTGAVSRGSGNQGENREKVIRRWFVEQNLIDAVVLLPDNLFYNTTAAGVIIVLRRGRAADEPIVLINASGEFQKGRPKNHLSEQNMARIKETFCSGATSATTIAKAALVSDIKLNDFSLAPSTYVETALRRESREIQDLIREFTERKREAERVEHELRAAFRGLGFVWAEEDAGG